MSKSKRSEIRMLREFAHFFFPHIPCFFCGKPLLDEAVEKFGRGPGRYKPISTKITLHHDDEDKANNSYKMECSKSGQVTFTLSGNLKPCHRACHKRHHAQERAAKKRGGTRLGKKCERCGKTIPNTFKVLTCQECREKKRKGIIL